MASRGTPNRNDGTVELPDVVPFTLPYATRLSWELGTRVVEDDESALDGEWKHTGSPWRIAIYRVTRNTVVVNVRTPVGRERFYGAGRSELESAIPSIDAAPHWRRLE